jgi:probable rRNA maturation factor
MEDEPHYEIAVSRVGVHADVPDDVLVRAIETTLRRHAGGPARIHLALVSDEHIARLNETHLAHEGATDVLTFDLRDAPGGRIDAEIVASVDTARREAARRGHDLAAELALYAVHGTLHLLGFDDHVDARAAEMHRIEDEILASLGLGRVFGVAAR